jgi:hypothetical protein
MEARNAEILPSRAALGGITPRPSELSVEELVLQVAKIQQVMQAVMKRDEHYGVIPGTPKPTLYKAGAEKLCLLFRLDPQYESFETYDANHLTVKSRCTLYHISSGERRGSGEGSCSTKETKYAYRQGGRKCPQCGKEAIIKGKEEYGGGWVCFKKKDGCGAKFKDSDKAITEQDTGRAANPDLPDQYNTVLKMANKRALIAAVLNVTAASDIFTQDLEDLPEFARRAEEPRSGSVEDVLGSATKAEERPAQRRADPEPPPPADEDIDSGPVISDAQRRKLWAVVGEKAEELGLAQEPVGRFILGQFGISSSKAVPKAIYNDVLTVAQALRREDLPA